MSRETVIASAVRTAIGRQERALTPEIFDGQVPLLTWKNVNGDSENV